LNKVKDIETRNEFIDRLVKLQTFEEEPNDISYISKDNYEKIKNLNIINNKEI